MEKILRKIYYDQKNPGSFSSVKNLYEQAKLINQNIKEKDVKDFLSKQLPYTLHYQRREKFERNKIIVRRINEQWESDLVDMTMFSNKNNGFKYIITIIDCFSKFAYVEPIKNKSANNIKNAFEKVFKREKPFNLRTDRGLEFLNKIFEDYLKQENVNHYTSKDQKIKCAIVERFNRTLKSRMFKYFTAKGTRKYIDVLQDFVKAYNSSHHRTIKMKPCDVNLDNQDEVFENIYEKSYEELVNQDVKKPKFKKDDKIRVQYDAKPFDKGFYPTFKDQIFIVDKDIKGNKRYVFKIKDQQGKVFDQVFYPEQLQKITEDLYRIEKILRKRTKKGIKEVFVKWMNYPDSFNSWIPETEVKDLKKL